MKIITLFIILLFAIKAYSTVPKIEEVRVFFEASTYSKSSADRFLKLLSSIDNFCDPVLICYKGTAEMMQARYGLNPVHKFRSFKKGKELTDNAVSREPDNIEIRFLRFSIQTNLPSFLNYNDRIYEDKKYLLDNIQTIKDKKLKQNISKYLLTSKYCSAEEKKRISHMIEEEVIFIENGANRHFFDKKEVGFGI